MFIFLWCAYDSPSSWNWWNVEDGMMQMQNINAWNDHKIIGQKNQHDEGFARHIVQNTMELIGKHVEWWKNALNVQGWETKLQDFLATSLVVCPLIFPSPITHIYEIVGQFWCKVVHSN
jgi:hypothetical protein